MDSREHKATLTLHAKLTRLWADPRFPATGTGRLVRLYAEALLWVRHLRLRGDAQDEWLRQRFGNNACAEAIRADAPRYEPQLWSTPCVALLTRGPRVGQACGRSPRGSVRVVDPRTGRWRYVGFCAGHSQHAAACREAERIRLQAGGIPDPVPNTGGLLPSHVPSPRWPDLYARYHPGWRPPSVGLCADDWPVQAAVIAVEPPRLALVAGGGETTNPGRAAALRVVTPGWDAS